MSARVDCPGLDCWQYVLGDSMSADERGPYERHLEACPLCQEQVHRADDSIAELRELGRRLGDPTVVPVDPTLLQTLQRLHGREALQEPADLSFLQRSDRTGVLGRLGPYEVIEVIGQGGMGIVLKALEPALQRLVAIKVLDPTLAGSATARRRFTREARAVASIRHENVVAVYGVDEMEGLPYLVMQYIAGESLQERLDRAGPLALEEVVHLGLQTACGLAAAHARGLIHRDIKPANLLLEEGTERVKITDFGLARGVHDIGLTLNGVVAGTPAYMAPEQARGEPVDHRGDLFSLGSVLYAACTGVAPFGGTTLDVLRQVSEQTPTPLRSLRPDVPMWLETLITKLMAKNPAERWQSASEVAAVLKHSASPDRQKPRALQPWFLLLGGLCATLLAGFLLLAQQAQESAPAAGPMEFSHDFRGQPLPAELKAVGDAQHLHFEPEGLRITLPADRADLNPVGVASTFTLKGDFELTTTFEILHADVPQTGWGVGVKLYVQKGQPSPEGANIARLARPRDTQILTWDRSHIPPNPHPFSGGPSPCTATSGRLRLQRIGTVLHYMWSPDSKGETFEEIHRGEFGGDDIAIVSVSGTTGRQPCRLDLRLLDFQLRGVSANSPLPPRRSNWKVWLALLLLMLLSTGVALAMWQSRRTRPQSVTAPTKHASASAQPAPRALPSWLPYSLGLAALLLLLSLTLFITWRTQPHASAIATEAREVYQDFRGKPPLLPSLHLFGPDKDQMIHPEAEGLRITLPDGRQQPQWANVGVGGVQGLTGDFEVTGTYELLSETRPRRQRIGVALNLGVALTNNPKFAKVGHFLDPKQGHLYVAENVIMAPLPSVHQVRQLPAEAKVGKLRLVRQGKSLSFQVSAGLEDNFREMQREEFGAEDLEIVRFVVNNNADPIGVDARLVDFRVRLLPSTDAAGVK
jgi:hypothetical protein